ncbi:MAG: T9SS type A sorting domain-containing protein [Chitinispirillaceae bacterium]|nr:T9SS type A sorting domain-containing protein [Chitinispirillaceae bacterium]
MVFKLALIFAVSVSCLFAQPYSGTIFNFPNSFKDDDPTALSEVTYKGQESRRVYDRRVGSVTLNVYVYIASFSDGCPAWDMMVNPEFSQIEAKALAEKYARNIGQMPICVRTGITGAAIHAGSNPWGGGNPLTIHTGQGDSYERQGIVTETMIHEATHAAFDRKYYTAEWAAAAKADGQYISSYARDNPTSEDHSETFLCWLAARYKKDRISSTDYTKITTTVPKRLKWYDDMNFNLSPINGTGIAGNHNPARSAAFTLIANYPNPFLSQTTIGYTIVNPSPVTLQILDMKGRVIRTLAQETADAGRYQKVWDAHNDAGQKVSSGTYIFKLIAGELLITRNMVLLP